MAFQRLRSWKTGNQVDRYIGGNRCPPDHLSIWITCNSAPAIPLGWTGKVCICYSVQVKSFSQSVCYYSIFGQTVYTCSQLPVLCSAFSAQKFKLSALTQGKGSLSAWRLPPQ